MTDRYNASHCADMTAAQAIDAADAQRNRERLETRAHSVIGTMLRVAGLAGYEVTGELVLTHRASGLQLGKRISGMHNYAAKLKGDAKDA